MPSAGLVMVVEARGVAATATRSREREAVVRRGMCIVSAVQSLEWYLLEVEE